MTHNLTTIVSLILIAFVSAVLSMYIAANLVYIVTKTIVRGSSIRSEQFLSLFQRYSKGIKASLNCQEEEVSEPILNKKIKRAREAFIPLGIAVFVLGKLKLSSFILLALVMLPAGVKIGLCWQALNCLGTRSRNLLQK